MITVLAIVLTWTCPTGGIEKTQVLRDYPKQLDQAVTEYKEYQSQLDILTKDFNGVACTLTSVKGGHIKVPKKVEATK